MQTKKRLCVVFGITILLTVLGFYFYLFDDESFQVHKILPGKDFSVCTAKDGSQEDIEVLRSVTSGPFTFLTEGNEMYVFVSQDKKYVIKFLKIRKLTPKYWLNYIPIPWLDKKRLSKISDRERTRQETLGSLKLAFDKFKSQTGLVFLHLFRTDYLKARLVLLDKEHKKHSISLDKLPFILQKKADLLPEYINSLLSQGDRHSAVQALCQILSLVKEGCKKGLGEYSAAVSEDYGFIDNKPVYVSIHGLVHDEALTSPNNALKEVFRVSRSLELWLQNAHPELLSDFHNELQNLLD